MPGSHALLSPSAAGRWMRCTAAPLLEAEAPEKESDYAREGTLAHALCARHLKTYLEKPTEAEDSDIEELWNAYHSAEMDEHAAYYRDVVLDMYERMKSDTPDAQLLVEVRFDFSRWAPGSYGTSDAVIVSDGTLHVIDFKYGKGVRVDAEGNPQMMIYALGALDRYDFDYRIERVSMTIIQPRLDHVSTAEMSVQDLVAWAETELKPKAAEATAGGVQKPGEWCRFCKVKASCRALTEWCISAAEDRPEPRLLTPDEMATEVLPATATIALWLKGVQEYALEQALSGVHYDGWKLVEGRSVRRIQDQEAVEAALEQAGYKREALMKPEELLGITELEKLVGKKKFGLLCGGWIEKPQGKPCLVRDDDPRPAFISAESDFAGLTNCN